ncbi:MAG: hypothetical protein AAF713_13535 [Pseudomonadota bacterium]
MRVSSGVVFVGRNQGDHLGHSISAAGDINGDGFGDLIFGAPDASWRAADGTVIRPQVGEVAVVFGRPAGHPAVVGIETLNGRNGFLVEERAEGSARLGTSVSGGGDIDGDGVDDVVYGSAFADHGSAGTDQGTAWAFFGSVGRQPRAQGVDQAVARGAELVEGTSDEGYLGFATAMLGDVNGDGLDDAALAIPGQSQNGQSQAGGVAVVLGSAAHGQIPDTAAQASGSRGFRILGEASQDFAGGSVAGAGDFNGDGFNDIVVGASFADGASPASGAAYLVFGARTPGTIDLATSGRQSVLKINGLVPGDGVGVSVDGAGDVNGDGFDDVIVGTRLNGGIGAAYVVFGRGGNRERDITLAELNGANGFRITGVAVDDLFGASVAGAGDVNGDGYDDILVGAFQSDAGTLQEAGSAYLLFGSADGFGGTVFVDALDGTNGYRFNGAAAYDNAGITVAGAGDLNFDGADDIMIAADRANRPGMADAGAVSLVYGGAETLAALDRVDGVADGVIGLQHVGAQIAVAEPERRLGTAGVDRKIATAADERLIGLGGNDRLHGNGGNDLLYGGGGNDVLTGQSGDDRIFGGDGNDRIVSRNGADLIHGGAGNDIVQAGSHSDQAHGDDGRDVLSGAAGNDWLWGDDGADRVYGSRGNDRLFGGAGNDLLRGDTHNDTLDGGTGNDRLTGGDGRDLFVFWAGSGRDTVDDFAPGADRIDYRQHPGVERIGDLVILDKADRVVLIDGEGARVALLGLEIEALDASSFLF